MAEHLTLVSLRRALSARGSVSEKVADDFLSALIASIQDGLQKDGQVTINGLGTFKLQEIPARESINVATGERFTIDGYKKVVFVAGAAHGNSGTKKTEEPIDPIQKLGEQAEEIKDILSELNAMTPETPVEESAEPMPPVVAVAAPKTKKPKRAKKSKEVEQQPEEKTEQAAALVSTEATEKTEPAVAVVSTEAAEKTEASEKTEAPTEDEPAKEKPKPFNPLLTGLITIGVFTMLLIIAYFVLRHQIVSWADGMRSDIELRVNTTPDESVTTAMPEVVEENLNAGQTEGQNSAEQTETNEPAKVTEKARPSSPYFDDSKRKFTKFQATETVGQDSRLAWVAKKHYGEKAMWVFVYEANRDRVKDPNLVRPGTKLRIPKLPLELRDINNPETKALLDRLSEKYLQ